MSLSGNRRDLLYFAVMAGLFVAVGQLQSWNVALSILNLCLISAVMALGVNIQWGYAGLFNVGIMGFAALGGPSPSSWCPRRRSAAPGKPAAPACSARAWPCSARRRSRSSCTTGSRPDRSASSPWPRS